MRAGDVMLAYGSYSLRNEFAYKGNAKAKAMSRAIEPVP